ncbi:MAG: hypothetical protein JWM68_3900 [Verrucomicrobiales bacterium]|nr:hypothetical protein [Verrucomicrobiales bacterium]
MTINQMQQIANTYQSMFTNWDELVNHAVMMDPRFIALVQQAIEENQPLTRAKMEEVFGELGWEE